MAVSLALLGGACGDAASPTTTQPSTVATTTAAPAPQTTTSLGSTTTSTVAATTTPSSAPPTTAPATDEPDVTATATIADGAVTTDTPRLEVQLGDVVELVVVSDISDELHVHGYDLFAPITPGSNDPFRFIADIPGIFEVELESSHLEVFELEVS